MQIDRAEVRRYLGCGREDPGPQVAAEIESALAALERQATPRHIWAAYPVEVGENCVRIASLTLESRGLAHHLRGCAQACLFAATLGPAPDRLMQRAALTAVASAVVLQAAAAAMIEAYCDECCDALAAHFQKQGLYLRPRFSPGYGDLSLDCQPAFLRVLDAEKRIGLTCTASHLMAPSKSVTAIIGLSTAQERPSRGCRSKCAGCPNTGCAYRLE